jgi:hypothetical protein
MRRKIAQSGLGDGLGIVPCLAPPIGIVEALLQTWRTLQAMCDARALNPDRRVPASASARRLALPFQKMCEQDRHAAGQLALLALAHVFDLLGEMLDIESVESAGTQQPRLLVGPGDHILFIIDGVCHVSVSCAFAMELVSSISIGRSAVRALSPFVRAVRKSHRPKGWATALTCVLPDL